MPPVGSPQRAKPMSSLLKHNKNMNSQQQSTILKGNNNNHLVTLKANKSSQQFNGTDNKSMNIDNKYLG